MPFPLMPAVLGQLLFLADPGNWEEVGDMSPAECASLAAEMVEGYMASKCNLGMIAAFPNLPDGDSWLACLGQQIPRADYEDLWNACPALRRSIPPTPEYIQLPDLRDHFLRGSEEASTMQTAGANTVTLLQENLPRHAHTTQISATIPVEAPVITPITAAGPPATKITGYVGQGTAFSIVPAHVTMLYCIRVK